MGCHMHRSDEWPEQLVGLEVRSALLKYKANTLCLNSISCHILRHHTLSTSYIKPGIFPLYKISSSPWMLPIRSSRGSSVFHLKQNLFWAPSCPSNEHHFQASISKEWPTLILHSFLFPPLTFFQPGCCQETALSRVIGTSVLGNSGNTSPSSCFWLVLTLMLGLTAPFHS